MEHTNEIAALIGGSGNCYLINVKHDKLLWSYTSKDNSKLQQTWRRSKSIQDYVDVEVNQHGTISLKHHRTGRTDKMLPWITDNQVQEYVKRHFGDNVAESSEECIALLDHSGNEVENVPTFYEIRKRNYKIYTCNWNVVYSKYEVFFVTSGRHFPLNVVHAYDQESFTGHCSNLGVESLDAIRDDIWFESCKLGDIQFDGNGLGGEMQTGSLGNLKVAIKSYNKDHKFSAGSLKIWKSMPHENLHRFYGVANGDHDVTHMVFEHCDYTLYEYVTTFRFESATHPSQKWINLFRGLLNGIVQLHRKGICHTKLTPWNIYVTKDGVPKISGFDNFKKHTTRLAAKDMHDLGWAVMFCHSKEREQTEEDYLSGTDTKMYADNPIYEWAFDAMDIGSTLVKKRGYVDLKYIRNHTWLYDGEKRVHFANDINDFLKHSSVSLQNKICSFINKRKYRSRYFEGDSWNVPDQLREYFDPEYCAQFETLPHLTEPIFCNFNYFLPTDLLRFVRNTLFHHINVRKAMTGATRQFIGDSNVHTEASYRKYFPKLLTALYNAVELKTKPEEREELAYYFGDVTGE